MLRCENISKYYMSGNNIVQALRRINLSFEIGEFVAITGESGSGKSTLLNVLSGLDTYEEGKLYFNNTDISHYTIDELEHYRKDYIGYVFQEYNIIESYTVYQNIELALTIQNYSKQERHQKILDLIQQVGLTHVTHQKASTLSGGEKQRTVIARTLAKDYQVLVCDEPTGNLNEEAARGIFEILQTISKDKLVILVTHDIHLSQEYATRKIRLYDGEIVEDSLLQKTKTEHPEDVTPKTSQTTFADTWKIAWNNLRSVPKKSLFSLLTLLFMVGSLFFIYSMGILERNRSYATANEYFTNPDQSRIIVTKVDRSQFTTDELTQIEELRYVRSIVNNDVVFDSVFMTKVYNEEYLMNDFYYYKPLPASSLNEQDLTAGRLPELYYEVVVADNGLYELGDPIDVANSYLLSPRQNLQTDQFTFLVVGFIEEPLEVEDELHYFYLSNSGLKYLAPSSIYEHSEIEIWIRGTEEYYTPDEAWITPDEDSTVPIGDRVYMITYTTWIGIDNSLQDNEILTFDMMYFDICRDFGFKKELVEDEDAGLCNATDFIASHEFEYRAITTFEDDRPFEVLTFSSTTYTDEDQTLKLFMNADTYNHYFNEENYQISVIVRDAFEGKQVVESLQELGYEVFYPSQVFTPEELIAIVIRNVVITIMVFIIMLGVALVSYLVLHNIIFSKVKDYLIIRSIGTSKHSVRQILRLELFSIALLTLLLILGFLLIAEYYIYAIPAILRYFKWYDFITIIGLIWLVLEFMVYRYTSSIFKVSVISSLKGAEQ